MASPSAAVTSICGEVDTHPRVLTGAHRLTDLFI
jgi:hypothetical protein